MRAWSHLEPSDRLCTSTLTSRRKGLARSICSTPTLNFNREPRSKTAARQPSTALSRQLRIHRIHPTSHLRIDTGLETSERRQYGEMNPARTSNADRGEIRQRRHEWDDIVANHIIGTTMGTRELTQTCSIGSRRRSFESDPSG